MPIAKDMSTNPSVDDERSENTSPHRDVDLKHLVGGVPTESLDDMSKGRIRGDLVGKTHLSISTSHGGLGLRAIKVRKANSKRPPVTDQAVRPPPFSKRHRLGTLAENSKKVDCQRQRPQRGRQ